MAKRTCHVVVVVVVVVAVLSMGVAAVDEMADCGEQVMELMPCLPFVEGEVQTATTECCVRARAVVTGSFRCLCVIIKDRDSLGFQIDVGRAVTLPAVCNAPVNISTCIGLLKSKSAMAREFLEFEQQIVKNEQAKANSSSAQASSTRASSSLPGGGREGKKRWLLRDTGCALQAWLLLICLSFWAF